MKNAIAIPPLPARAPWHNLSWRRFLPLVSAGNVVVASLAWVIVGLICPVDCDGLQPLDIAARVLTGDPVAGAEVFEKRTVDRNQLEGLRHGNCASAISWLARSFTACLDSRGWMIQPLGIAPISVLFPPTFCAPQSPAPSFFKSSPVSVSSKIPCQTVLASSGEITPSSVRSVKMSV
jgi:hypothetical protein